MMDERPPIFLGDLVRAIEHLQPSDDTARRSIARLLGMPWNEPFDVAAERQAASASGDAAPDQHKQPGQSGERSFGDSGSSEKEPSETARESPRDFQLISSRYAPSSAAQESPGLTIDRAGWFPVEEPADPPPLEPLFAPQWIRGILSAALATDSGAGLLDLDRIVEALARGERIWPLPALPWPTLSRGVQVLIDRGLGMAPFARDQVLLQEEIQRVVGKDQFEILRFAGCPSRGAGTGAQRKWRDYQPPLPGTPILLLTDLGSSRPLLADDWASVDEWLEFAEVVRRAGCPLVAFVPYTPSRLPAKLVGALTVIQWDRRTTAVSIRNLIGPAHEGTP